MQFKGADLGNAYKWSAIKKAVHYEQERDHITIYEGEYRAGINKSERFPRILIDNEIGEQDHVKKTDRFNSTKSGSNETTNGQYGISNIDDRAQSRTYLPGQKASEQTDDQTLRNSDFVKTLLDHHTTSNETDQIGLNKFKRKKRKRLRM
jgi:hypothetical protein